MKQNFINSLARDKKIFKTIKKNLGKTKVSHFNFKVKISKQKYLRMVKLRYISCLLDLDKEDIISGIRIAPKYKNQIKFTDTLKCISYRK